MYLLPPRERASVLSFTGHTKPLKGAVACLRSGLMGEVFVDRSADPQTAIGRLGFVFLCGRPNSKMLKGVVDLTPSAAVLVPDDADAWGAAIAEATVGREVRAITRYGMHLDAAVIIPETGVPPGFDLVSLDFESLRSLCDVVSQHFLRPFWPIPIWHEFGVAYAVVDPSGRPVAGATSFAVGGGSLEVEIATHENFRRRGFARILGRRIVNHCLQAGLTPCWDAANTQSVDLAIKLGYVLEGSYTAFSLAPV